MAKEKVAEARVNFVLRGETAEKLLRIAAREGNGLNAVSRRLISVGLRYETEPEDTHNGG